MNPDEIMAQYGGYWGEHPAYSVQDWQYEVANGDTRAGYWLWVTFQLLDAQEGQ